jgi:hypothetical protein
MSGGYVRLTKTSSSGGAGVTAVTGDAPIQSSGGATPAISIPQSDTETDGYLSSGDWATFNNKQNALVSGTNIKTLNGASILGSGNAATGYQGFRYNIQIEVGYPPLATPPSGYAYVNYYDNGEGGADYGGWSFNNIDADGNNIGQFLFSTYNEVPYSVFTTQGTYALMNNQGAVPLGGIAFQFAGNDYVGIADLTTLAGTVGYFNFGTPPFLATINSLSLYDYNNLTIQSAMASNLNGTTISVGRSVFLGIGSSTADNTESNRSVAVGSGKVVFVYLRTAGVMTGSMVVTLMRQGIATAMTFTIAAGSAAARYGVTTNQITTSFGEELSLRVVQSTATSSGVLSFGFIIQ